MWVSAVLLDAISRGEERQVQRFMFPHRRDVRGEQCLAD